MVQTCSDAVLYGMCADQTISRICCESCPVEVCEDDDEGFVFNADQLAGSRADQLTDCQPVQLTDSHTDQLPGACRATSCSTMGLAAGLLTADGGGAPCRSEPRGSVSSRDAFMLRFSLVSPVPSPSSLPLRSTTALHCMFI